MQESQSNKFSDTWVDFDTQKTSLLEDYFSHEKLLKANIKITTQNAEIVVKESISKKNDYVVNSRELLSRISFYKNNLFSSHIDNQKCFIHYEANHFLKIQEYDLSGFIGLKSKKSFEEKSLEAGIQVIKGETINKAKLIFNQAYNNILISNKLISKEEKFTHSYFFTYDISAKILKNCWFELGWKENKNEIKCRLHNLNKTGAMTKNGSWLSLFNAVSIRWLNKINENGTFAVESLWNTSGQFKELKSAIQYDFDKKTQFKMKISSQRTLAASIQNTFDQHSYTFGLQLKDVGRQNQVNFGFEFALNL